MEQPFCLLAAQCFTHVVAQVAEPFVACALGDIEICITFTRALLCILKGLKQAG